MNVVGLIVAVLMAVSILLIPVGLPGLWILAVLVGVGTLAGEVPAWAAVVSVLLAVAAEVAEYLVVHRMNVRYGGSSRAFWAAIAGGFAGVVVGVPIPVIGSVIGGFVGSFLGAAFVTFYELRDVAKAGRVGWGVLLARTVSVGLKVAAAVVILVIGGTAWILR